MASGTRSIDQMVEAAIWLMVQGDRAGAEALLQQVLRIDPTHERARQAMKSTGATTSPGELPPTRPNPIPQQTQPVIPRTPVRITEATPMEPLPALQRADALATLVGPQSFDVPPGLLRRTTLPGMGTPFESAPTPVPTPAPTPEAPSQSQTDRHLSLVRPEEPPARAPVQPSTGKAWSLEVLTGPHTGTSLPVSKRPMLIGKGLGVLDVESDLFMSAAHASFFQRAGELWISDGGSASGTWLSIDGPWRLAPGDSFSVGMQRFKYLGPVEALGPSSLDGPPPYGAPRPAASWRLEHVLVGARPGRTWLLRGMITVGRESATLRFPDDEAMASVHAELRPAGAQLELIDRSARIGTFIALATGGERKVLEGTRVRLGGTVFRVTSR